MAHAHFKLTEPDPAVRARLDWLLPQLSGRDLISLGVIYEAATPFWFRKAIDAAMPAVDSRESECPK